MSAEAAGLRLLCRGVVQGVGFRPWVYRLATELALDGALINGGEGVSVELSGARPQLQCFLRRLVAELPAPARLEPLLPQWGPAMAARGQGVRIDAGPRQPLGLGWFAPSLAPDRAPCAACLAELNDPANRRFGDPFISCARCGPRYSIALARPYRRAHTTLAGFAPCDACRREFADPGDRRFHAETIGCPRCGPRLCLWDQQGEVSAEPESPLDSRAQHQVDRQVDPLGLACELLAAGRILALQGVGGFQLLVDAANPAAVARLRQRKRRPSKPFALLVADEAWLAAAVWIDAAEQLALRDGAAPIVLLRRRPSPVELWPGVAPGSPALGVMRPASPLHHLLVHRLGRPLVATSGNRSGEPLCSDPLEARQRLAGIADAYLVHDRPIARPLDDSLLQVIEGRPVLLRRARGYAPEPLPLPPADPSLPAGPPLLALSGDFKCAPGLALGDRLWLAPHLGDLADRRCQERLVQGLAELTGVSLGQLDSGPLAPGQQAPGSQTPGPLAPGSQASCNARLAIPELQAGPLPLPITLVCDAHPGYLSHQLARCSGLPLGSVQHHLAHGLAVMAEHDLEPPLLVAAFDGLGYGEALLAGTSPGGTSPSGTSPDETRPHGTSPAGVSPSGVSPNGVSPNGAAETWGDPAVAPIRLWGGELLLITKASGRGTWRAEHLAGLRPFPLPGGERAQTEPRRAALGLLLAADALDHPGAWRTRQAFAAADLALLCQAVAAGCQAPLCSSGGRLFDGVASLLGLVQVLGYEGEGGPEAAGGGSRQRLRGRGAGGCQGRRRAAATARSCGQRQPLLARLAAAAAAGAGRGCGRDPVRTAGGPLSPGSGRGVGQRPGGLGRSPRPRRRSAPRGPGWRLFPEPPTAGGRQRRLAATGPGALVVAAGAHQRRRPGPGPGVGWAAGAG